MYIAGEIMDDWIYFATYEASTSAIRALPSSFTELYITASSHSLGGSDVHFIIPRAIIPDVNSIDQSLGLVEPLNDVFGILRIWSGGMVCFNYSAGSYYDVYYR